MTPEEREEAERLRKVAAKYGTDPTAIVGRLQLTSQYLDLPHGARARDGWLVWMFPIEGTGCFGLTYRSSSGSIPIFPEQPAPKA